MMVPINVSEAKLDLLARTFGCSKGALPFTYLGLPLGTTKPVIQDFLPLVGRCERRLAGVSMFLSQAGRLQITNAVLTSLPTFYMCTLAIPKIVIKQIDKFRKHCLWRGSDINAKNHPKAAWKMVRAPKEEGGLGIIDIGKQNEALLLKNLHKFFNKLDIPWVHLVWEKHYRNGRLPNHVKKGSFWWKDVLKLLPVFKDITSAQIKNGKSCMLWLDRWDGQLLNQRMPELFSFAKNKFISVDKAFSEANLHQLFSLPLSEPAFQQLHALEQTILQNNLVPEEDTWGYRWGSSIFSSSRVYRELVGHIEIDPAFIWLWKSYCQPKHKVFFWLLIKDRLSTRNLLRRRNMHLDSFNCELCSLSIEESVEHLFLTCPFARQCWGIIGLDFPDDADFPAVVNIFKDQLNSEFFMVAVILLCWTIWSARNKLIFEGSQWSIQDCRVFFHKEILLISHRVIEGLSLQFDQWITSLF